MTVGVLWPDGANCKALYQLENANDSSGNGKTFTGVGVTYVAGKFGVGAKFDNTVDRLYRNDPAGIDPDGDLTFMFWIKFDSLETNRMLLTIANSGNRWHLISSPSGSSTSITYTCGEHGIITKSGIVAGRWYNFIGTCSSSGVMKLYVDGSYVNSSTADTAPFGTYFGLGYLSGIYNAALCTIDLFVVWQEVKSYQWVKQYYAWATGKL